jgi:hypothetical protein
MRDTTALAASIICLMLVVMSPSLMLKLKAKHRRPQDTAFGEYLERVQSRRFDDVRDECPLPSKSGGSLAFLCSAVRPDDVSVPRTIGGRQGAADYFIPPTSIAC